MVKFRALAVIFAPLFLLSPAALSAPLEIKAVALVESRAPAWKAVPESALIDVQGLSFKRKFFLEGRSAIPVRAPEVRKALAEALKPLSKADRSATREILKAIEEWAATSLIESEGPLACPSAWLAADQVLRNRTGNRFELVRAITPCSGQRESRPGRRLTGCPWPAFSWFRLTGTASGRCGTPSTRALL